MGIFNYLKPIDCTMKLFVKMVLGGRSLNQIEQLFI